MIEKAKVPPLLTAQWKSLKKGRNARYRSGRFRDHFMKQFNISSVDYFYKIINGKIDIDPGYIKFAQDLMNNVRNIR
ncbi:hypothetical protein SAMN04515674_101107 [Pseudarcicella hirudinis]|uniref:Uncharacterized protein n=2 Tax=Pseudarcicella hirudinis TaxID=1079859 RepID=A0A1I5M3G1_9BACT|nr:hypothetical protein SAMN04515674_101107 [Pseudarcicella hirudinis]